MLTVLQALFILPDTYFVILIAYLIKFQIMDNGSIFLNNPLSKTGVTVICWVANLD